MRRDFDIIVIGGGHAGAEAAWAACNLLASTAPAGTTSGGVALVTLKPDKIGAMSCNPAIGGLAKGQIVREVDALGGLMGLAADATGIQFRVLNQSKGPAVHGPRCQSDKYAYAREVQRLLSTRGNLTVIAGAVEDLLIADGRCVGVSLVQRHSPDNPEPSGDCCGEFGPIDDFEKPITLSSRAVILTTGTFMRGLMHTGESQTPGGRVGEGPAVGISDTLKRLGFELGRLKTGTPPRLRRGSLDLDSLQPQPGDDQPVPFSEMTLSALKPTFAERGRPPGAQPAAYEKVASTFPVIPQTPCWITHTDATSHALIRDNIHRAPMYNGQIAPGSAGPRYCPSIEDKVVRFADRESHHVFLEPESHESDEIYCNGISTSLPPDVQDVIVSRMPGCAHAEIIKHGYAVEYDMVWPHQIDATGMTKRYPGLFLAGQINGTSGYEEAAAQGLVAGLNAVRFARGEGPITLRRDQAYIGVLMDDLITKTPREPYRMFSSRAEHRLLLRSDNAPERLTPLGRELGLIDDARWRVFESRSEQIAALREALRSSRHNGVTMERWAKRPGVGVADVVAAMGGDHDGGQTPTFDERGRRGENDVATSVAAFDRRVIAPVLSELQYAGYIKRQQTELDRLRRQEQKPIPTTFNYEHVTGLRNEARQTLMKFRPSNFGQAGRLAGITPADLMVLSAALGR